jgi:hypothetical protein
MRDQKIRTPDFYRVKFANTRKLLKPCAPMVTGSTQKHSKTRKFAFSTLAGTLSLRRDFNSVRFANSSSLENRSQ